MASVALSRPHLREIEIQSIIKGDETTETIAHALKQLLDVAISHKELTEASTVDELVEAFIRLSDQAQGECKEHDDELAKLRSEVRDLEDQVAAKVEENERLKSQMERAHAFREREVRTRVNEEVAAQIEASGRREYAAKERACALDEELTRLRRGLESISASSPEDAVRLVRVLVGREILEKTGTLAEVRETYVPTRSERRKKATP